MEKTLKRKLGINGNSDILLRKLFLPLIPLILSLTISGCVTYKAVGMFQKYNEVFYGDVNANLIVGGSNFIIKGQISGITCTGSSNVTYIPPFGTCRGQRGNIFAVCDDGRTVTGEWFAQSCTKGWAEE